MTSTAPRTALRRRIAALALSAAAGLSMIGGASAAHAASPNTRDLMVRVEKCYWSTNTCTNAAFGAQVKAQRKSGGLPIGAAWVRTTDASSRVFFADLPYVNQLTVTVDYAGFYCQNPLPFFLDTTVTVDGYVTTVKTVKCLA